MEQVKGCFKELYVTRYWYVCESDYTCPHHKILGQYTVEVATVSEFIEFNVILGWSVFVPLGCLFYIIFLHFWLKRKTLPQPEVMSWDLGLGSPLNYWGKLWNKDLRSSFWEVQRDPFLIDQSGAKIHSF